MKKLAEKALELRPNHRSTLCTPGGLLYRAGRYEDAVARLQQSMEVSGGEGKSGTGTGWQ
jgi:hypothetical protein